MAAAEVIRSSRPWTGISFISVAALLLVAILLLSGCKPHEGEAVVRIGYTPLMYAQPTFVAIDQGLLAKAGVKYELTKFENSTQIVNALLGGQLDFCAISPVLSAFAAQEKSGSKEPLFQLYYYNLDSKEHPISYLLVRKDSDITSLEQLRGKTIGVFPGNILSRISAKLLLKPYFDPDKELVFQDVAPQLQAQTLESKQIDAMFSLEPYATLSLELGQSRILHVAPQLSVYEPLPAGAGFMNRSFIKQHPDTARRFGQAIREATQLIRKDPAVAKSVLPKYTPLTSELAEKVRQPQYHYYEEMPGKLLDGEYQSLIAEGVLKGGVNASSLIYKE
jgi:ABC-type nitrate/sulfonate/bicarbonate transport system substrate-binding protein